MALNHLETSFGVSTHGAVKTGMAFENGLTTTEARERLIQYGYNEIVEEKTSPVVRFIRKFWGITPWMLEVTIALEWLLGKYFEAYIIVGLLVFNAILGFFQEEKANSALELLKQKLKINARVKRDGNWCTVPARELVPGDVVRLRAGDFVPADVKISDGTVDVDKSSLTGESQPIECKVGETLYSGSVIKRGEVTGLVVGTGEKTYFGRTVELVQVAKPKLHMEEVTSRVVRWLVIIVSSFIALALALSAARGMSLLGVLPLAVVLMVSAIPVALPTMFTISMALGSLDLMKKGILITRLSAIEDAAIMNIICADKTGTMTMNKLTIAEILPVGDHNERDVIRYGALASEPADQDPIDLAFIAAAQDRQITLEDYHQTKFLPFDPSTRRTEAELEKGSEHLRVMKGAVNTIIPLCNDAGAFSAVEEKVENLSKKGYRAIAVAEGTAGETPQLAGIVFLYDKPRSDSPRLIRELKALGVGVKMLTGDALPIAREIAQELGLGNKIESASDLKRSGGPALALMEESDGFAEIYPEDKYMIVGGLQKTGRVVGMTGDGVNDAPALRQAEVGIAVSSATDVAKKAASAVLTTEGLEGIVDLVKIGRMTYQRIITWILNKIIKTFQITVFVVLVFLFTGVYVMSALHMILLLFLTDFVTLSISTDNVRYSEKPDTWDITGMVKVALLLGLLVIGELVLVLYVGSSYFGLSNNIGQLQTFTFEMLIYVEMLDLLIIRERKRFWASRPSYALMLAIMLDLLLVYAIASVGLPGITPIPFRAAISVPILALCAAFLVNDLFKVALIKKFWR